MSCLRAYATTHVPLIMSREHEPLHHSAPTIYFFFKIPDDVLQMCHTTCTFKQWHFTFDLWPTVLTWWAQVRVSARLLMLLRTERSSSSRLRSRSWLARLVVGVDLMISTSSSSSFQIGLYLLASMGSVEGDRLDADRSNDKTSFREILHTKQMESSP